MLLKVCEGGHYSPPHAFKAPIGWGNLRERDHWGDPDIDGRIILSWVFGKWEGVETGWSWLRIGTDGGHL